jgi:hypothetical protein
MTMNVKEGRAGVLWLRAGSSGGLLWTLSASEGGLRYSELTYSETVLLFWVVTPCKLVG